MPRTTCVPCTESQIRALLATFIAEDDYFGVSQYKKYITDDVVADAIRADADSNMVNFLRQLQK